MSDRPVVVTTGTARRRHRRRRRPMATRNGKAEWEGELVSGSGRLTVGDDRWTSEYSFNSRFHGVLDGAVASGGATNPEELLAAPPPAALSKAPSPNPTRRRPVPRPPETQARGPLATS